MTSEVLTITSCLSAGIAGWLGARWFLHSRQTIKHLQTLRKATGASAKETRDYACAGLARFILNSFATIPSSKTKKTYPAVLHNFANRLLKKSSFPSTVALTNIEGSCIALANRNALACLLISSSVTLFISPMLLVCITPLMFVLGWMSPFWALKQEQLCRNAALEKELPVFLDLMTLCLKSGLAFDRCIHVYTTYYQTALALSLSQASQQWSLGLVSRSDALLQLASSYDSKLFSQLVRDTNNALVLGTGLVGIYEQASIDTRRNLVLTQKEINAKAPIKMMIPLSTLILPAMLLLVLGPVLLTLMNSI